MKIIYLIITVITIGLSCNCVIAQQNKWQTPKIVSIGKELPRSEIVPFDTEERALSNSSTSKYVAQLSGEWTTRETDNYVEFSREFKRPFSWVDRAVMLRMEGVTHAYEVYINDKFAGYNQSSITAAEFNITKIAKTGANSIKIKVFKNAISNSIQQRRGAETTPSIGKVYISSPPKVMIRDFTVISSINSSQNGIMELGVILKSQLLNSRNIKLFYDLYSPEGELVSRGSRGANFDMQREDTIRFLINIPKAKSWSHETPNLYTILLSTQHDGRFTEYVNIKSGFRTVSIESDKVLINGNEVRLAVKEYYAAKDSLQLRTDLEELKKLGYNTIKVQSHPQSSLLYELCDEIGLYICNQADINTSSTGKSIAIDGNISNNPIWESNFVDRVMTMYHSSKNNPSVIMFSMAENSENGYNLYESYIALKKVEHIRPIVYIGAKGEWNSDAVDVAENSSNKHNRIVLGGQELKVVSENIITVTSVDLSKGKFTVKNNYSLTTIYADATYSVKRGRRVQSEGKIPLSIAPNSSKSLEIPFGDLSKDETLRVNISINRIKQVSTDFIMLQSPGVEEGGKMIYMNLFKSRDEIDGANTLEELYTNEYKIKSTK